MMIRPATAADFPRIADMGVHFHALTAYRHIPYSHESMHRWCGLMQSQGMLFVAEDAGGVVGSIGGVVAPLFFNDAYRIGQELFWWVEPEHRKGRTALKLLRAIEAAALTAGTAMWSMLLLDILEPEKIERLYQLTGYRPTERTFSKVMPCQQPLSGPSQP